MFARPNVDDPERSVRTGQHVLVFICAQEHSCVFDRLVIGVQNAAFNRAALTEEDIHPCFVRIVLLLERHEFGCVAFRFDVDPERVLLVVNVHVMNVGDFEKSSRIEE